MLVYVLVAYAIAADGGLKDSHYQLTVHDTWKQCMTAGYEHNNTITEEQGYLLTDFNCVPIYETK